MQNSVYNTVLLWRNGGEQDYCMCLAYICRQIPIKDKLEEWSAVSRNGYWAEQMSGLRGWLFTIYLFRASPLWNTHYFSHLLSMNYSSSFVSCLCDLFRGLVRKWWLMGRAWQVEYNGHYLALLGVKPQFQGLGFLCTEILILVPELKHLMPIAFCLQAFSSGRYLGVGLA